MMKKYSRKERGVTLVSLAIATILIIILTNIVIYNSKDKLEVSKLEEMQNDITNLRERISSYYAQNGKIPASIPYNNIEHIKDAGVISNAVDTGEFFVIDLSALENLTLNRGEDFKKIASGNANDLSSLTDLYIINETSHNIFYVAGITLGGETYYTDYTSNNIDKAAVNLKYVESVEIPDGFYYVGGTKDTGIVISDMPGDDLENTKGGNQFVWVPVPNIDDFHLIGHYSNNSVVQLTDDNIEPNIDGYNKELAEYDEMKQSVKDNQGFYIGRFEAGNDNENVVVKKNVDPYISVKWEENMTGSTQKGALNLSKSFAAENSYTSVKSTLCYGVQWDAVMQFIDNNYINGQCTVDSYVRNSNNKGNYSLSVAETGNRDEYSIKNIYDLAGNVREWTMEAYSTTDRVCRGGDYTNNASMTPASARDNASQNDSSSQIGFRIALYLNIEDRWSPKYDKEGIYTDKNGDTAVVPKDFCVSQLAGENTVDSGLVVKDKNDNEWVWIEVPKSIYRTAGSGITNFSDEEYNKIEKDMQYYAKDYRDVDYSDTWYDGCGLSEGNYYDLKKNMLKSVYQNGGFYIARYEAGIENDIARTSHTDITDSSPKAVSKRDKIPYNYVDCSESLKLSRKMHEDSDKTTSLMFGIQWDLTLKFIESKGGKTKEELKEDYISWGNYYYNEFYIARGKYSEDSGKNYIEIVDKYKKLQLKSVILTTGNSERNSVLEIYDIAGNVWERTLEKSINNGCFRGGDCCSTETKPPASYRYDGPTNWANINIGFRPALW